MPAQGYPGGIPVEIGAAMGASEREKFMNLTTEQSARVTARPAMVRIWDPLVRIFHWSVVVSFFVAYFTEDDLLTLHVWAGYTLGGLLVFRLLWGFIGPKHARFSDFVYAPATVIAYIRDLVGFRAKRYLGHSPAGGAMIFILMLGLAAVVWTGLELYAAEEGRGPLAAGIPALAAPAAAAGPSVAVQLADNDEAEKSDRRSGRRGHDSIWEDLHEVVANLTFVLVILHIGGVALASLAHRENLVRGMVTGLKRAQE